MGYSPTRTNTLKKFFARQEKRLFGEENASDRLSALSDKMLEDLVDVQREFVLDMSSRIAAVTTRQAGKSYSLARRAIKRATSLSNVQVIIIYETYKQARSVLWKDPNEGIPAVLRNYDFKEKVDYTANNTSMYVKFSNNSSIELYGLDKTGYEKLRGLRVDEICVDEAQKCIGLEKAYKEIIIHCLARKEGSFVMTGTPSEFCTGFLHDVNNTNKIKGWKNYGWSAKDLSHVTNVWETMLKNKEEQGISDDDPIWQRECLGMWVRGGLGKVFNDIKTYDGTLPTTITLSDGSTANFDFEWRHILSVDIGYSPAAWSAVVLAWSKNCDTVYEIESFKKTKMNTDEQITKIQEFDSKYNPEVIVIDQGALGVQISEDYRDRGDIYCEAAQKYDKAKHLEVLQTDVLNGKLIILEDSELHKEMITAVFDQKAWLKMKKQIEPSCPHDSIDALLYGHRKCYHFRSLEPNVLTEEERQQKATDDHRKKSFEQSGKSNQQTNKHSGW